jgi:hypothetical protein
VFLKNISKNSIENDDKLNRILIEEKSKKIELENVESKFNN